MRVFKRNESNGSGETGMNLYVHTQTRKSSQYGGLRIRAYPRHGGQGDFFGKDFCSMLNNKLNAHGSFTPAALAPPKRDNPEQEIRHLV